MSKTGTTAAADGRRIVAELIQLLPGLTALLREENETLARHGFSDIERLAEDKARLSLRYERLTAALAGLPANAIEPTAKTRLRQLGAHLAEAAAENERRLAVANAAHRHLMAAITEAVRGTRPRAGGYGRSGALAQGGRGGAVAPVAISLNRAC